MGEIALLYFICMVQMERVSFIKIVLWKSRKQMLNLWQLLLIY